MAKKIELKFGNREIKPAQIIEETHAAPVAQVAEEKEQKEIRGKRKRASKDWKRRTVLLEAFESKKIDEYLEEKEINFNSLIKLLLEERGIL